jgi:hypothetical protein
MSAYKEVLSIFGRKRRKLNDDVDVEQEETYQGIYENFVHISKFFFRKPSYLKIIVANR